jgi:hypothetical protein
MGRHPQEKGAVGPSPIKVKVNLLTVHQRICDAPLELLDPFDELIKVTNNPKNVTYCYHHL